MRSMIYRAFFFRSIFFGFTSQNSVGLNLIFIDLYLTLYHKYPHDKINYGLNPTLPPPKSIPTSPTNSSAMCIKIFTAKGGNEKRAKQFYLIIFSEISGISLMKKFFTFFQPMSKLISGLGSLSASSK